jgi:7-cyano-7-deazaguanine synthase
VMQATVVPGRNLLFISHLVAKAQPGDEVWIGVHAGDRAIYSDCRSEFIITLGAAVLGAYEVLLVAPFINMTKADIAEEGDDLGVPFEMTWSCYEGGEIHCGRCGTCVERREALHLAKVADRTEYADQHFWEQVVAGVK